MSSSTATRIPRAQHNIDLAGLDPNSLEVVERLKQAGYSAYLVGGCVRDLLLSVRPKDFDVATNATPENVKEVFRRVRIVGRRFRIAHVRYGRDIIEVSTFRCAETEGVELSPEGMILRDNEYGTLEEDAFRRDFTINALYYDPTTDEVLDFVGGLADLNARRIVFIGDAATRLAEDPVRLLRAVRFKAKLGFDWDAQIDAAMPDAAAALEQIPPARLFEEFIKLFMLGYGRASWEELAHTPARVGLFPCTPPDSRLVALAMENTDNRIAEGKPVTPGFLLAVMLWEDFRSRAEELLQERKPAEANAEAAFAALGSQNQIVSVPRRFSLFAREVWQLQPRLEQRRPGSIYRVANHERFRAAYDLLLLRAEAGEPLAEAAHWWTEFQELDDAEREAQVNALGQGPRKRRRRRRRRKDTANTDQASDS